MAPQSVWEGSIVGIGRSPTLERKVPYYQREGSVRHLNYHPVAILSVQQGLDPAGNNYLT